MSRVKYREFIGILEAHGFSFTRQEDTHHFNEGVVNGRREVVSCDYNQEGEDISPRNFASMIRQSKLPRKLFR